MAAEQQDSLSSQQSANSHSSFLERSKKFAKLFNCPFSKTSKFNWDWRKNLNWSTKAHVLRAVEYYEKQIAAETDESKKKKLFVDLCLRSMTNSLKLVYPMNNLSIYSDETEDISEDDGEDEVIEREVNEREVNESEEDGSEDSETDGSVIEDTNTEGFYEEIACGIYACDIYVL